MPRSGGVLTRGLRLAAALLLASGLGLAQTVDKETEALARAIFSKLEVRLVPCPPYTFEGGNTPVCGLSDMDPKTYTQALDRASRGMLEPQGTWDEDHTVWLRRYSADGVVYAAVYSEIARGFNVQIIRLK